jgi:hypothetical protein
MKHLRIYLIVMGALFVGALLSGICVWYIVQNLYSEKEMLRESPALPLEEMTKSPAPVTDAPAIVPTGTTTTISVDTLTEVQKTTLKSMGYSKESITITPDMMMCAKEAVGDSRYAEVLRGAQPTTLEMIRLLPCLTK